MNDLEVTIAAVRVLNAQTEPNLEARKVALYALREFVNFHTPKLIQQQAGMGQLIGQALAHQGLAQCQANNVAQQQK